MLQSASQIVQASLDPQSGEIKQLPQEAPKPVETPTPAQAPDQAAAAASSPPTEIVPPKPDPLSKGFAAMAKKDRELRQRSAQLRAKEQEISQREAQIDRFEQLKNQNPVEAIKSLGMEYDDLVRFQLLGNQTPTTELQIKEIKEAMQKYVETQNEKEEQLKQSQARAQQARVQQTLQSFNHQVSEFVKSKTDEYELVNLEGEDAISLVAATVEEKFQRTKKLGNIEDEMAQAAKWVEEYLVEDHKKKQVAKKFQGQTQPQASTQGQVQSKTTGTSAMERAANALSGPRPTLNNSMTASTAPAFASPRIESDRMSRALAALSK